MTHPDNRHTNNSAVAVTPTPMQRFTQWAAEPMGSVVVASALTIGSFGLVLSGIWFVNLLVP